MATEQMRIYQKKRRDELRKSAQREKESEYEEEIRRRMESQGLSRKEAIEQIEEDNRIGDE